MGEEAGVGDHAVVGAHGLSLDVPARLRTSMVSAMAKSLCSRRSRSWTAWVMLGV